MAKIKEEILNEHKEAMEKIEYRMVELAKRGTEAARLELETLKELKRSMLKTRFQLKRLQDRKEGGG